MEKVNVIVGRFQPLTLGHLKGAEEVWNKFGIRTVFCIVDTPESKLNEKHPFPSEMIISQNEMLGVERYFGGFAPIVNADIGKIAKVCRDIDKEPVMWTCGSDRVKAYEKQCIQKYIDMYDLDPKIRVHEIKRTDDDISASKVRDYISRNDYKGYCKLMPGWSHDKFELYKNYIVNKINKIKYRKMQSIKEFLNESLRLDEKKTDTQELIDFIIASGGNNERKMDYIIKKSTPEVAKLTGCSKDDVIEVLDYVVEHVTVSIEDWSEDILDYDSDDAEEALKLFVSSFVEGWYDNIIDDDPDREYELLGISNSCDDIADVIIKHLFKIYKF